MGNEYYSRNQYQIDLNQENNLLFFGLEDPILINHMNNARVLNKNQKKYPSWIFRGLKKK